MIISSDSFSFSFSGVLTLNVEWQLSQEAFLNEFSSVGTPLLVKKFSNVQNKTVNGKSGVRNDCIKQGEWWVGC